jgi:hypothetical protein
LNQQAPFHQAGCAGCGCQLIPALAAPQSKT